MNWIDLISGAFQAVAGFAVMGHVFAARKAGGVQGVSVPSLIFFAAWSCWNLFMFLYLHMPFAAFCAFLALAADLTWLTTVITMRIENENRRG